MLVPNYQAGKDFAAGFKLDYKGEIVEESYMPLNTTDFQVELTKISSAKPDAVFTFMPGGMGVGLVKQYRQAGLADSIPVLSAFTVDESTLPAQQDAAVGMFGGANWAPNLDNPQNKKFVAGYEAAYNSVPGTYAMQAYDTAMLIDSAVKAVKGDLSNKDAVSAALKKADFTSLRGDFKFNTNGYPIQNFYLTKVAKRAGRQIPDRDRREGLFELRRPLRQGLHAGQITVAASRTGRKHTMKTEIAGITRANEGMQGISWNILGQTYVPKNVTEHSFSWHATFPPGHLRAAAHPSRPGRVSLHPGRQARLLSRRRRDARRARRSGAAADGQAARHLQQVRPDRKDAVLGVADPPALRSVLGHPQHEGADAGRRGGAGGRAQHPLPAAASGGVSVFTRMKRGWSARTIRGPPGRQLCTNVPHCAPREHARAPHDVSYRPHRRQ